MTEEHSESVSQLTLICSASMRSVKHDVNLGGMNLPFSSRNIFLYTFLINSLNLSSSHAYPAQNLTTRFFKVITNISSRLLYLDYWERVAKPLYTLIKLLQSGKGTRGSHLRQHSHPCALPLRPLPSLDFYSVQSSQQSSSSNYQGSCAMLMSFLISSRSGCSCPSPSFRFNSSSFWFISRKARTSFCSSLLLSAAMYLWKELCLIFSTQMNSISLSPLAATYLLQSSLACYTGMISSAIECMSRSRPVTRAIQSMLAKWSSLNLMSRSYSSQNMQEREPIGHCRIDAFTPSLAAVTVTGQVPRLNPHRMISSSGRPTHASTISKSPHITSSPTLFTRDSPQPVKSNATYSALNLLVIAVTNLRESPKSDEFPWEQTIQGTLSPSSILMGNSLTSGTL